MKITKPLKAIGERSGRLKKMCGAEISDEISKTVTVDEQIAITMNALEAIFAYIEAESGKDIRPEDFKKYEILRADVKEAIYGRVKSI
jgi:hypothetical protein